MLIKFGTCAELEIMRTHAERRRGWAPRVNAENLLLASYSAVLHTLSFVSRAKDIIVGGELTRPSHDVVERRV